MEQSIRHYVLHLKRNIYPKVKPSSRNEGFFKIFNIL